MERIVNSKVHGRCFFKSLEKRLLTSIPSRKKHRPVKVGHGSSFMESSESPQYHSMQSEIEMHFGHTLC